MHSVGVNTAEMRTIKRILSAILHLGNVTFKDNGEGHISTVNGDKSRQHMEWACELLGIDKVRTWSHAILILRGVSTPTLFQYFVCVFVPGFACQTYWLRVSSSFGCAAGKLEQWLFLDRTQRSVPCLLYLSSPSRFLAACSNFMRSSGGHLS